MATVSNFALRLPPWLMEEVKALAAAALKGRGYLAERAKPGDLGRVLAKTGSPARVEGDEAPEGWPKAPPVAQAGA